MERCVFPRDCSTASQPVNVKEVIPCQRFPYRDRATNGEIMRKGVNRHRVLTEVKRLVAETAEFPMKVSSSLPLLRQAVVGVSLK